MTLREGMEWEFFVKAAKGLNELDKINSEFLQLQETVHKMEQQYDADFKKMEKTTSGFRRGISNLAGEFPMLGNAIRLATSPLGLLTLGVVGITAAFSHGAEETKKFNNTFLEVKNLNLDKTTSQMDKLRESILMTSFDNGLNPDQFARAMFDVQSATGKYGDEVVNIVQKIGVFSRTMKSDFNETINGASKAMGIFKFGAEGLDDYLASSAKVVQLGITTFDQLAKVQTEYSGAAAASGQGFDEANKIFATFTKTTKNVDIAATMTKGFFEDLKKLEKIKIKVFENGEFRTTDNILKDVNDKFKKLDNQSISNLIEEVGGNEGLRGLLKQVQANGDDVLQLFKDFDNTEFDFDKALENANGDLQVMNEIVSNKLSASWIRLGDTIAPILLDVKSWLADALDWVGEFSTEMHRAWTWFSKGNAAMDKLDQNKELQSRSSEYMKIIDDELGKFQSKDDKIAYLNRQISDENDALGNNQDLYGRYMSDPNRYLDERWGKSWRGEQPNVNFIDELKVKNEMGQMIHDDRLGQETNIRANKLRLSELEAKKQALMAEDNSILDLNGGSKGGGGGGTGDNSIKGISVAGAAVRHVTVNIENLIRENNITASSAQNGVAMTADEIVQLIVRAVRDAELTLSSN